MADTDGFLSSMMSKIGGLGGAAPIQAPPSEISGTTGNAAIAPNDTLEQINESKDKTVPAYPQLALEGGGAIDPKQFQNMYEATVSKVVSFITDQMAKSVEEQNQIQREEWMRKIRLGIEAFSSSMASDGAQKQDDSAYVAMVMSSVAAILMLSGAAIGQVQVPQIQGVELFPVDLQTLAAGSVAFVSAGLIVPLLGSLAMETISDPKVAEGADEAVAAAYAQNVMKGIQSGAIGGLIAKLFEGEAPELIDKLKQGVELHFLLKSLAMLGQAGLADSGLYSLLKEYAKARIGRLGVEDPEAFLAAQEGDSSDLDDVKKAIRQLPNMGIDFGYEKMTSNPV